MTVHPLIVRITHWINAFAVLVLVLSGWRIYNAARCSNPSASRAS